LSGGVRPFCLTIEERRFGLSRQEQNSGAACTDQCGHVSSDTLPSKDTNFKPKTNLLCVTTEEFSDQVTILAISRRRSATAPECVNQNVRRIGDPGQSPRSALLSFTGPRRAYSLASTPVQCKRSCLAIDRRWRIDTRSAWR